MVLLLLCAALLVNSCTLVNRDQPNDPPVLDAARIDQVRVRRGDPVRLEVVATDEDYDPLFFVWEAYRMDPSVLDAVLALGSDGHLDQADQIRSLRGLVLLGEPTGGFTDSLAQIANAWYAPRTIQGESERFLLVVSVRDHDCRSITDAAERERCGSDESQFIQLYSVEVTQRAPLLSVSTDTVLVPFRDPTFELSAQVTDPDGDPLQVVWRQTAGPEIPFSTETMQEESHLHAVPFFVGDYTFTVEVSDAADTVSAAIPVRIVADPAPPSGGMVSLTLADGTMYEMDRYEYPNQLGALPRLTDDWFTAARACASQNKRLCSRMEWIRACSGSAAARYSSTDDAPHGDGEEFGHRFCNTVGSASAPQAPPPRGDLAPSGTYANCFSDYGVYDLTGNAREWVGQIDAQGSMVGGVSESDVEDAPADSCSAFSEFLPLPTGIDYLDPAVLSKLSVEYSDSYLQYRVGFRCCR